MSIWPLSLLLKLLYQELVSSQTGILYPEWYADRTRAERSKRYAGIKDKDMSNGKVRKDASLTSGHSRRLLRITKAM